MRTHVKVLFAAFAVGLLAMPAWAQDSATTLNSAISGYESAAHESFQGLATDWSSHHVVYSKPEAGSDAKTQSSRIRVTGSSRSGAACRNLRRR